MKTLNAIAKWVVLSAAGLVALVLLVCLAAYLPLVQDAIKRKVESYVARNLSLRLDVERLRLRFPLVLRVDDAVLWRPGGDTVARVGQLRLGVAPLPLLHGNVQVRRLRVSDATVDWVDSTLMLKGDVKRLVLDNLRVSTRNQRVRLERLALAGASLQMHVSPSVDTVPSPPAQWNIAVQRVDFERINFTMDSLSAGLSAGHIDNAVVDLAAGSVDASRAVVEGGVGAYAQLFSITDLELDARRVHTLGSEMRVQVAKLALKERRGVSLTRLSGEFELDAAGAHAHDMTLKTAAGTQLEADLVADTAVMNGSFDGRFEARLKGAIAAADIKPFYALPAELEGREMTLDVDAGGSLNDLEINTLQARLEPFARLDISGRADIGTGEGSLKIDVQAADLQRLVPSLTNIPKTIAVRGTIDSKKGTYVPDLHIIADDGKLEIRGLLNLKAQKYDFHALCENLPVPGVGALSMALTAKGEGFDPRKPGAHAAIDAAVQSVQWRGATWRDIALKTTLENQRLTGRLTAKDPAAALDTKIAATLDPNDYQAAIDGHVQRLDLARMGFSATPLEVAGAIDARASIVTGSYKANVALDSAAVTMDGKTMLVEKTTLSATADAQKIIATLRSGDIYAVLNVREGVDAVQKRAAIITDTLTRQIAQRNFRFAVVDSLLPRFNLNVQAGRRNVAYRALEMQKMGFGTFSFMASRGDTTSLRTRAVATQFFTGDLMLDTLSASANIRRGRLGYHLRMANRPGNMEQLALIYMYGTVDGRIATANFQQRNRAGQTGFAFGIEATLSDSLIRASIRPPAGRRRTQGARTDSLTFAYEPWGVNAGNYVEWRGGRRVQADVDLQSHPIAAGVTRKVRIASHDDEISLGISRLDIAKALDLLPSPPPLRGMADLEATVDLGGEVMQINGVLGASDLVWDGRRVGSLGARITTSNADGKWTVDAHASIDGVESIAAQGTYNAAGVDIRVEVPTLPLSVANPFIPADVASLSGSLTGRLDIDGPLDAPLVDGSISFKDSRLTLPMLGTSYAISSQPIRLIDNVLRLRGFGITAPNNRALNVSGSFDIDDMTANLAVSGTNFQIVNASRNVGSQIYGVAAIDADVTVRGALERLVVRGDLDVLRTTNVTYTMCDTPATVGSQKQQIVTFLAFTDSLALELQSLRQRTPGSQIDLQVGVSIQEAARATVNISDNGNDRIELTGGGDLALTMNDRGEMRLAGRYALSGGTVVYNPPVPTITQKNFKIRDGSHVAWLGAVAEPQFNITADQTVRTTVEDAGGLKRSVDFTITISIAGTLNAPKIVFDLSAPADLAIQNELSSLEAEQRAAQAMALMIYNTYTGPGTTARVDSNNAVYAFLEKELNQWARNTLRGVDLSLGIRAGEDEAGNKYTNYSYKVSKSLFGDRVKVSVGGKIDNGTSPEANMRDNFVSDVSLEYRLAQWDNLFLKAYRYNTRKSILEGEVIETGGGVLYRKRVARWRDLLRLSKGPEVRDARRVLRDEERQMWRDTLLRDSLRRAWRGGEGVAITDSMRAVWRARRDSLRRTRSATDN